MNESERLERYFIQNSFGVNRKLKNIPEDSPVLVCHNGTFAGKEEEGICVFKGIPFACPPVGPLRWRAPKPAPEDQGIYEAFYNGRSPIQTQCDSERASAYPQGEDCLYLNIWMAEPHSDKRTVMVFLHGGAFGWGGTADPLYNGFNFVKAHPEIVLITVGYRTGLLGFVDFSAVEGGENYPDAPNLGILDQIEALRWIRKNCEAFCGDPDNITVFGESAGGASVSLLPLIPSAKGLFRRVIAQSGSIALTFSKEQCQSFTKRLLSVSGAKNMTDLVELSEEQLSVLNEKLNDYNNFPQRDGKLIPKNLYAAYQNGDAADVDLLSGTNAQESRYWIGEVGGIIPFRFSIPVKFENDVRLFSGKDRRRVIEYLKNRRGHSIWRISDFYTEMMFRLPAIFQVEENAANGGRSFLYYWDIPSETPFYQACHAVELSYVFGNPEETIYTGTPADQQISSLVQQMWVNFAKYGDPSLESLEWPVYEKKERKTMIISKQSHVEADPKSRSRRLLWPLLKYRINPSYAGLSLNTPFVRRTVSVGAAIAVGLIAGGVVLLLTHLGSDD